MNPQPSTARHPGPQAATLLLAVWLFAGCQIAPEPGEVVIPAEEPLAVSTQLVDVTADRGPEFVHETGATGRLLMPEIMTSGVALFDHDGDGDLDLYFTNGSFDLSGAEERGRPVNRLYRLEADGRYVDATEGSGLDDSAYGMGVAVGDVDNDGDPDVYLTQYGADRLYRNRGDGTFEDVTAAAGIAVDGWSSSASFLDFDRDGWLDLYVARYVRYDPDHKCTDSAGRPSYCSPQVFDPLRDVLLHNDGDGSFTDVSAGAGIHAALGAGLGVVAQDFDEDGWVDVYVTNDGHANQLWINRRDGSFRDEAMLRGAAYSLDGEAEAGMGVVAADFDNDMDLDLFMTHLDRETNTLYRNRGSGRSFEDVSGPSGLAASSLSYTGFGTAAFDLELDGDLDLVVVNGRVTHGRPRDDSRVDPPWDAFAEPNLIYLNDGNGGFEAPAQLGAGSEISRGLAAGDIDGDGDIDLVVSNAQSGARLYRNDTSHRGSWLLVRAVDPRYRRDAIGARVTVAAGGVTRTRSVGRGFSYQSSSDPRVHFGLGPATTIERLAVRWPDGPVELFDVEGVNREVELTRGEGRTP